MENELATFINVGHRLARLHSATDALREQFTRQYGDYEARELFGTNKPAIAATGGPFGMGASHAGSAAVGRSGIGSGVGATSQALSKVMGFDPQLDAQHTGQQGQGQQQQGGTGGFGFGGGTTGGTSSGGFGFGTSSGGTSGGTGTGGGGFGFGAANNTKPQSGTGSNPFGSTPAPTGGSGGTTGGFGFGATPQAGTQPSGGQTPGPFGSTPAPTGGFGFGASPSPQAQAPTNQPDVKKKRH